MNNVAKKLAFALLLSVPCMQATNTTGQSFYFGHQQRGTMNDILGWNNQINLFGAEEFSFVVKAQSEGGMSFSNEKLAQFFTANGKSSMVFGPAHTATTYASTDVSGINFLLDETFSSTVTFNPKITSWVTDFAAFADLSNWVEGLHVRAHLPLQYLKQEVELMEVVGAAGGAAYTTGNLIEGTPAVAYTNVVQAFAGTKTVGDVLQTWKYGTINGSQNNTKVSDVTLAVGYNFLSTENYHLGLEVGGSFGAGGKSKAVNVFEPTFGNLGRHSVFGTVDGHAVLWNGENDDKQLSAFLNGKVGYVFANEQKRSYDLTNFGNWSRYLLVKKVSTVAAAAADSVYAGVDNMINIGTLNAKIGDYVTYDASLLLDMQYNNFNFNVGYEFAGHSSEKHNGFTETIAANTYIVHVPGLADATIDAAITESDATAVAGATNVAGKYSINGDYTTVAPTVPGLQTSTTTTTAVANSWLDVNSALAKTVMSHAVVGGVNYTWRDNDYAPCLGLYGKAEIDGKDRNTADFFSVGVQGNVSF